MEGGRVLCRMWRQRRRICLQFAVHEEEAQVERSPRRGRFRIVWKIDGPQEKIVQDSRVCLSTEPYPTRVHFSSKTKKKSILLIMARY